MRKRKRKINEYIFIGEHGGITADSVPDLDDWGWDSFWGCDEWITWHKAMKRKYGLKNANIRFATEWNKQGFGAHALGCRTIDSDFRQYVRANGLLEIVWQSAEGLKYLFQPIGTILETGAAVGGGIAKGLQTTGKSLKYVFPIAIGITVIFAGILGYRYVTKKKI